MFFHLLTKMYLLLRFVDSNFPLNGVDQGQHSISLCTCSSITLVYNDSVFWTLSLGLDIIDFVFYRFPCNVHLDLSLESLFRVIIAFFANFSHNWGEILLFFFFNWRSLCYSTRQNALKHFLRTV